ncbi:MAG: hypothetical protein RIS79_239 [Verrucomicrobiota bacterium]|jgi:3D (Asp-Asp-Asp) domain-containing protein
MCNLSLIHFGAAAFVAAVLSSCALPMGGLCASRHSPEVKKSPPLQSGVRYEVRKAIATTVPFRPKQIRGYTFVLDTPTTEFTKRPLMLAAVNRHGSTMRVRTTAYTHTESDHIVYGVKNATGTNLRYDTVRSAAADWSRFPVGTRFCIASEPGVIYEVDDYGSALVGTGTIDLYKPSRGMMDAWGVRHVEIQVLQWGSYERSAQLMKDRARWPHVRQMLNSIQTQIRATGVPTQRQPLTASL